jgi:hypothetical protein
MGVGRTALGGLQWDGIGRHDLQAGAQAQRDVLRTGATQLLLVQKHAAAQVQRDACTLK